MKIWRLPELADSSPEGAFLLGREALRSRSISVLYVKLRPKESGRKVPHGASSEEIIYVLKGNVGVRHKKSSFKVGAGETFYLGGGEEAVLENLDDSESACLIASAAGLPAVAVASAQKSGTKEEEKALTPPKAPQAPGPPAEEKPSTKPGDEFIITREGPEGD